MRRARAVDVTQPLLGVAELAELLKWSRRKVATYLRRGALPPPVAHLACGPIWQRGDVLRWLTRRDQASATQERQAFPRDGEPPLPSAGVPTKPVRFVSRFAGLTLFGGPRGTVRFVAGQYATADPAEIAWLRRHPGCGTDFREATDEGAAEA